MAKAISRQPSTVQSWKSRGSIPDDQKTHVWEAAKGAGVSLMPEHFVPFDIVPAPAAPNKERAA